MPTPFMHLEVAENIRNFPDLQPRVRDLLDRFFPAFYLGSVAPDMQTISDLRRFETHFYHLPPHADERAYPTMLANYPIIAKAEALPPEQAVFVSAYCAHLMLDLRWYREVLIPYFVDPPQWDDNHQRFIVHNTLLTYLDKLAFDSLPDTAAVILAAAKPDKWLPFADDADLIRWQEVLLTQLSPGARLRTVEIYADRLYMSPEEFAANLEEQTWMQEHLFARVPVSNVQGMITSAVSESANLITNYLLSG